MSSSLDFREGTLPGGLPYLALGSGTPLVYLCGWTAIHRNPKPGVERWTTARTVRPLAQAGFEVFFTNRWPGMRPHTTFAEVADVHAEAILRHFGRPVDVIGHSTGGSLVLQLVADRPDAARRAVAASAAYRLGPVAKHSQLEMLHDLEEVGHFRGRTLTDGLAGIVRQRWIRRLVSPAMSLVAPRITVDVSDAATMLRAEDAFDVYDRLGAIETPTLVICGAQDYDWTPEMFAETAFRMPHGRLVMYPNRGHTVATAPEFFTDVIAFLREE